MFIGWIARGTQLALSVVLIVPTEASEATLKSMEGGLTLPGGLPGVNSVPARWGVVCVLAPIVSSECEVRSYCSRST